MEKGLSGESGAKELILGPLPKGDMAETGLFDALPQSLTCPDITPKPFAYAPIG